MAKPFVVAFDLDMTLIDSRPGVAATLAALERELQQPIDIESIVGNLGPPIAALLSTSFPPREIDHAVERFRELYRQHGVAATVALPGAAAAADAVRSRNGTVVVITAKHGPNAELCLAHVGIGVDSVLGDLHGDGKRDALSSVGATIYVGDTPSDVAAARAAEVLAVAVGTGPFGMEELRSSGADVILDSLSKFPRFLENHRS